MDCALSDRVRSLSCASRCACLQRPGVPFHCRKLNLSLVFDSQLRVVVREVGGGEPILTLIDCFGGSAGAAQQHSTANADVQMDVSE